MEFKSAIKVNGGIQQPQNINPVILADQGRKRKKKYSPVEYFDGILAGNRTILSQAITLIESSLAKDYETAQTIIEKCLPYSSQSIRIGITGVPGAGKSTFIETFGLFVVSKGRKLAVLTVDPSSEQSRGSILGDKTRMGKLSVHPDAFIRPTPSSCTFGGVARNTRETIILCEAAGFDTILVETVGVGQSETAVHSMVDIFLLLILAGAGDELQGIKRGIMEMADLIAITKADGANKLVADTAKISCENALYLFPAKPSGFSTKVLTCSALENTGINELWEIIMEYVSVTVKSGYFEDRRKQQSVIRMNSTILEYLKNSFYTNEQVRKLLPELEQQLHNGTITSYNAAVRLLDKYFKK